MCSSDLRLFKAAVHPLDIVQRPSRRFRRNFQTERIDRLQQNGFCFFQSLPHRTVRRLAEVAALGVLNVRTALDQRDFHIGNLRPGQHAGMLPLQQMCEDQTLPVTVQHVLTACSKKLQTASRFSGFQKQVYFCIMTQRFKMAYTFYRLCDCFFIYDISCAKLYCYVETLTNQRSEERRVGYKCRYRW